MASDDAGMRSDRVNFLNNDFKRIWEISGFLNLWTSEEFRTNFRIKEIPKILLTVKSCWSCLNKERRTDAASRTLRTPRSAARTPSSTSTWSWASCGSGDSRLKGRSGRQRRVQGDCGEATIWNGTRSRGIATGRKPNQKFADTTFLWRKRSSRTGTAWRRCSTRVPTSPRAFNVCSRKLGPLREKVNQPFLNAVNRTGVLHTMYVLQ